MDKSISTNQLFSIKAIKDTVTKAVNSFELKEAIDKIGVFGSVARGDWHKDSDIDLIIDYDFSGNIEHKVQAYCKLSDIICSSFPVEVNLADFESLDYEGNNAIKSEILKDVIWIYG
ncbi:MAG: nucleotidyltransferase domain-containing protein [Defluviitaleaceae bacterium]|nr:nucleotidyltransferase domain-containing protein [Defluviitaleaceae bacterium]